MIKCINVNKSKDFKKDFNEKWAQIIKLKLLAS